MRRRREGEAARAWRGVASLDLKDCRRGLPRRWRAGPSTGWNDRDAGYYAILGMELPRDTGDEGVVAFAVNLMVELAPMIRALVRP